MEKLCHSCHPQNGLKITPNHHFCNPFHPLSGVMSFMDKPQLWNAAGWACTKKKLPDELSRKITLMDSIQTIVYFMHTVYTYVSDTFCYTSWLLLHVLLYTKFYNSSSLKHSVLWQDIVWYPYKYFSLEKFEIKTDTPSNLRDDEKNWNYLKHWQLMTIFKVG